MNISIMLQCSALLLAISFPLPSTAESFADLRITMVLWRGETDAERGFKDGLNSYGYQVSYLTLDAQLNRADLAKQLRAERPRWVSQSDYLYSFGTTATRMLKQINHSAIPHIFNIVTDPVRAGISPSWQSSGEKLAGVSHQISLPLQLATARQFKPIERLGFFFNPRERNSELIRQDLQKDSKNNAIDLVELRCPPNSGKLQQFLNQLKSGELKLDAVYLPLDSYLLANAKLIGDSLRDAGIFSVGAQQDYITHGAVMGLVPDYYQLGRVAAGYLHRHQNGQPLATLPVFQATHFRLLVNETSLKRLGLKIPREMEYNAVQLN